MLLPISTWNVDATRPSSRSATRACRTDVSVTSYTVMAESEMSCWASRHATAMSGRPAGASGMNRLPTAESSMATIATGPIPQRAVDRVATIAPMNDDAPPTPATMPTSGRADAELVDREQEPRRPEDAPQHRHQHLGPGERPKDGVVADQPDPLADLVEDRLAILTERWRRLRVADREQQ